MGRSRGSRIIPNMCILPIGGGGGGGEGVTDAESVSRPPKQTGMLPGFLQCPSRIKQAPASRKTG